jgi:two-component system osmolarity sensor histidine kinase EnvZ
MVAIHDQGPASKRVTLLWRFNRWLERHAPEGLYGRSLIIIIAPIVLLQTIMATVFMERHWASVSTQLSKSVAREIGFVADLYENLPKTDASIKLIEKLSNERLALGLKIEKGVTLPPPAPKPFFAIVDYKLSTQLKKRVGRPFWLDTLGKSGYVDIRVLVDKGTVLRVLTKESRAYTSNSYIFILWMIGSSLVLVAVAVVFLRNQIRPIQQLAEVAQSFGLGRDVPDFFPRGAREVQEAARAFIDMKQRIERHVEQRTIMLAGVSHDLRTILTRFKLQLAFLDDGPDVDELRRDVEEMQHMLEDYMAFVGGSAGEKTSASNISTMLVQVRDTAARTGTNVQIDVQDSLIVNVKENALKRSVSNLVANAARHGSKVKVSAHQDSENLILTVEDDGPGIPASKREDVLRPFVRLDDARNQDDSGSGLGLTIALDIVHGHGGELTLGDSELGGLKATMQIPV